jgi:hypothetical protein
VGGFGRWAGFGEAYSEVLLKNHVVTYKKAKKTGGRNNQKELAVSIGSTFLDTLTILFGYDLVAKY